LMYRTLFYVNIYGSYKILKNSPVFLAHPVFTMWHVMQCTVLLSQFCRSVCHPSTWNTGL